MIKFENVVFGYGEEKNALNYVSFHISEGEQVGLIGANGQHRSWLRKWIKNGVLIMSTLQIRNGKIFPSIIWHLTAVNLSRIKLYR